jgi:hypothetical protein
MRNVENPPRGARFSALSALGTANVENAGDDRDFPRCLRWAQQTWKTAGDDCDFPHNALRLKR